MDIEEKIKYANDYFLEYKRSFSFIQERRNLILAVGFYYSVGDFGSVFSCKQALRSLGLNEEEVGDAYEGGITAARDMIEAYELYEELLGKDKEKENIMKIAERLLKKKESYY